MRLYPPVSTQSLFAQNFTNLSWEETTFPWSNFDDSTKSVTDFALPSLPYHDVDILEAQDFFDVELTQNAIAPSSLEVSLLAQPLDSDTACVWPVTDTFTSSDSLNEQRDTAASDQFDLESPLGILTQSSSAAVFNEISEDDVINSLDSFSRISLGPPGSQYQDLLKVHS